MAAPEPVCGLALVTTPSGETCTLKELWPGPRAPQRVGDRVLQRPGQGRPRRQALGEGRCSWVGRAPSPRPLVPGGHSSEGWMGWCPLPPPTPATRGGKHTYPGIPPASILLATVTSVDHTSYCQRFWPRTPPSTVPVCTPTRMSTPVFVFSRTYLPGTHEGGGSGLPVAKGSARTQPPSRRRAGWPPPALSLHLSGPQLGLQQASARAQIQQPQARVISDGVGGGEGAGTLCPKELLLPSSNQAPGQMPRVQSRTAPGLRTPGAASTNFRPLPAGGGSGAKSP